MIIGGNPRQHRVNDAQGVGDICFGDWQASFLVQVAEEAGLHLVEQRAASQRIHSLQRQRLLVRLQSINRRQDELIRTGRKLLQRRQRIGTCREAL